MTERETETAARPGGLAWQKARRVWGADRLRDLPDWPDALTPDELAALQYPREGEASEKRKALTRQRAMLDALNIAIKAGDLGDTLPIQRAIFRTERDLSPGMEFAGQWLPASLNFRKVRAGIKECQGITRHAFAAWLHRQAEDPSAHIRAWLGDAWPVATAPAGKVDAKREAIRALLGAIAQADASFSPDAMPGRKADFFELCRAYDRLAFMTVALATFDGYLSGLCRFKPGARATDYYRQIAPRIGVKLGKPT